MIRKSSTPPAVSLHELELAQAGMSAALNDYFANGLSVESIEQWAQDGCARVRRNRQQFVGLFPSIAPLLALQPDNHFSDGICRAVDRGDELVRAIASEFFVSPATVRHLRGVPWSIAMDRRLGEEMYLLGSLEFIPQENRPRDETEWITLWTLIDSLAFVPLGPMGHVLRDLCRRGYDNAFQLAMDYSGNDLNRLSDFHDYFMFVQRWAEALLDDLGTSHDSAAVFLSGYGFPALWRQSEEWHKAVLDPAIASIQSLHEVHWPSLLPEPFRTEGLIVTSLCSASELLAEGRGMKHCVASYTSRCLSGESHILSIRTANGTRHSTVEISLTEAQNGMVSPAVVQHRGHGNVNPPDDAKAVLADLLNFWRTPVAQDLLQRSLQSSREFSATMSSIDRGGHSLIPRESCALIMQRVLPNYDHCVAKLERIAGEIGKDVSNGPLAGNPILNPRFKRRFA